MKCLIQFYLNQKSNYKDYRFALVISFFVVLIANGRSIIKTLLYGKNSIRKPIKEFT